MLSHSSRLLLIEDQLGDARMLAEAIKAFPNGGYQLVHETGLSQAIRRLESEPAAVVLLDLGLAESRGLDTYRKLRNQEFNVPIIVLCDPADESAGMTAVQEGAQDSLVKGDITSAQLYRAIRYAVERHHLQSQLRELSLVDPLTGLYNRRGIFRLVRQEMKTAQRLNHGLLILLIRVPELQEMRIRGESEAREEVLLQTAELLRGTFRESDIVGYIGGGDFAAAALNADQDAGAIVARLQSMVERHNRSIGSGARPLSLEIGYVRYPKGCAGTLEELMEQADAMLQDQRMEEERVAE